MAIFTEAGRGRKQCPKCKLYTGVFSATCEKCSHKFEKREVSTPVATPKVVAPPVAPTPTPTPKVASTFDGPGRGRKQCSCGEYVGAKLAKCPSCHRDFVANPLEPKMPTERVVQTFDEPAKGRKQCPSCGTYVSGLRTSKCPCGHDFTVVATVAPMEIEATVVAAPAVTSAPAPSRHPVENLPPAVYLPISEEHASGNLPITRVYIPAGECPVKLKGTEIEQVASWADAIRDHFGALRMSISVQGLFYFTQTIYDFRSDECKLVKSHLAKLFVN